MVAPGSRRNQFWQSLAQISEMAEEVLHPIRTWITPLRPGRDAQHAALGHHQHEPVL